MGCITSKLNHSRRKRTIRKSAISKPHLIPSPTSTYSFTSSRSTRPTPTPSLFTTPSKLSSDSAAPTITLTSPTPSLENPPAASPSYFTQSEISLITAKITRFVGTLTTYGQLLEKTHLALTADLLAILALIPLPIPPPSPPHPIVHDSNSGEVTKISLQTSYRKRLTKIPCSSPPPPPPPPSSSSACQPTPPPYTSHASEVRAHLQTLQSSLASTYSHHHQTFATKYCPLITLLPRNWITFSRLSTTEQEADVLRHLYRRKGEPRARDGLVLEMIRGLGRLACVGKIGDAEKDGGEGNEGFEGVEKLVERFGEDVLVGLKGIECERERIKREEGKKGEKDIEDWGREGRASMKWRVFGLVLNERVRIVKEKREEILRERVRLSGVFVGVFESVGEGVEDYK